MLEAEKTGCILNSTGESFAAPVKKNHKTSPKKNLYSHQNVTDLQNTFIAIDRAQER